MRFQDLQQMLPQPLPETLMRYRLIIILTFLTIKSYGQCGQEYPSGFCHSSIFVTHQGDTLNKLDNLGFYQGLHLYTYSSDSNTFIIGNYRHGQPVGEWKYHCSDSSYSFGQFKSGIQSTSDGNGGWVTKKQGIYSKDGVWKYFDKDSQLIKTQRFEHFDYKNGWAKKIFIVDTNGTFILVNFESKYKYYSKFRKETTIHYTEDGIILSAEYNSFWRDVTLEYYNNSQVSKKTKRRKFLGKALNKTIEKEYNYKGQLENKIKTTWHNRKSDSVWKQVYW
ncbi:hypothetical protein CHU_2483 [Cytophaga hutchinsonii ATCC 33406]|uniref:Uncharacterized protein n=2 Tax=Cytophaga hutchinsonii TaxID=985 RepID=A0A6N4STU8_CYTH3|nr:hypothetical protein CHU_2483 [Cytophaga hutchinsonii ATCC 33406]